MRAGSQKVTRKYWYSVGGLSNGDHYRKHNGRCWEYYIAWW